RLDKADRLIFTQDGEQRKKVTNNKSEWTFNKYDAFGRLIISGIYKTTENQSQLITRFENVVFAEKIGTGGYGYTWDTLKQTELEDANTDVLFVNYYDDISHLFSLTLHTDYKQILAYTSMSGYGTQHTNAKGQLVATRVKNIDSAGKRANTREGEIATAMYYDNRGRLIQTKSTNHLGGVDSEYLAYNFTGQPIKKLHIHSATGKNTQKEEYVYTYDHAGRLLKTTHQLTDGSTVKPQVVLAENTYDELGRLKTNKKGGVANTLSTYAYNVRSWTKSISSPVFNQTLYYNDKVTAHSYSDYQPAYNGNISGMEWQLKDESKRSYRFKYDNLSRLTHAAYNGVTNGGMYNVAYAYDKHGNLSSLTRRGKSSAAADNNALVDQLSITYVGNQMIHVSDAVANFAYAESADFKDKVSASGTIEYTYNANGAMDKDLNKGITGIQYNSLNLPRQMVINSSTVKAKNYYTYSASGVKLKTEQRYDPTLVNSPIGTTTPATDGLTDYKNTDYVGNIIYETSKSSAGTVNKTRILVDGGYIENGVYHYYLADHLGNNRVVVNASGTITQRNHYYPFGTAFAEKYDDGKNQKYKYNGKELDDMHQLNLYDYSARYYESAVGRFTSVDPLAEMYYSISPYAYVMNNPLRLIDPTGMYSTEEWKRDNGITDDDLISIYEAPDTDDVVISGRNNSSLTIKTSAINKTLSSNVDFGGNQQIDACNIAIGYESYVQGTAVTPVGGVNASIPIQNVLFLGGSYSGHWYKYIGLQGGFAAMTGADLSVGGGRNWFIALNSLAAVNNNTPSSFAGGYVVGNASISFKALGGLSINGGYARSIDGSWNVFSLGASASLGYSIGMFDGFGGTMSVGGGYLKLVTPAIETNQRSRSNSTINWGMFILDQIPLIPTIPFPL
ncbi:RHS repeat-associated core domain-containing protein, partial [Dysgonomonas sp. Marseille-P4677]|uniref:RHS repeat domain-containing protein n=1 Tax=Dysgonomonas sp. Marseille-P4677 TaxID=2364790 RepID=UPI0019127FB5